MENITEWGTKSISYDLLSILNISWRFSVAEILGKFPIRYAFKIVVRKKVVRFLIF